jgi:hypothetical protein
MTGSCKITISGILSHRILILFYGFGADTKQQICFESPAGARFSLLHSAQTSSGALPASDPMGTGGGYFSGARAIGA